MWQKSQHCDIFFEKIKAKLNKHKGILIFNVLCLITKHKWKK